MKKASQLLRSDAESESVETVGMNRPAVPRGDKSEIRRLAENQLKHLFDASESEIDARELSWVNRDDLKRSGCSAMIRIGGVDDVF